MSSSLPSTSTVDTSSSDKPTLPDKLLPDTEKSTEQSKETEIKDATSKSSTKKIDKPNFKKKPSKGKNADLKIKHTIQNLAQLNVFELPTTEPEVAPKAKEPIPVGIYFDSLKVKTEISTNVGSKFTIDVQSDTRFLTAYLHQVTNQKHQSLINTTDPYLSVPSYIGYQLSLFYIQNLVLDIKCRENLSSFATPFSSETRLINFIDSMLRCRVPPELGIELKNLAPVYDPLHTDLEYVPNYSCFSLQHDFGRTIPAYTYFLIHNVLSDIAEFSSPRDLLNKIYETQLFTYGEDIITISNLFGGPFLEAGNILSHTNWLRESFERLLLPSLGSYLEIQPTLIDIPLTTGQLEAENLNPYSYLLFGSQQNLIEISTFMLKISESLAVKYPDLPTLGSFLGTVSGITILSHSVEPTTLPTWHTLSANNLHGKQRSITDTQIASKLQFCVGPLTYTDKLPYPKDASTIEKTLYLVDHKKYSPTKDPVTYVLFKTRLHTSPDVMWFQPYSRATGMLNHVLVLGLKIETAEIDGVTIPIPNPLLTLMTQNSEFIQGSIPIWNVFPTFPLSGTSCLRIRDRTTPDGYEPISFNRRTAKRSVLPYFGNDHIDPTVNGSLPFYRESGHNSFELGTTYVQWTKNTPCPQPEENIYMWSSYRYRSIPSSTTLEDIHFYYTLRGIYGLNTVLSRSRNPSLLLPK